MSKIIVSDNIEGVEPIGLLTIQVADDEKVGQLSVDGSGEEGIGLHQTRKVEVESVFPTDFQVKEDGELVTIKEIVDGIDTEAVEQAEEDGLDVTFTGLYTESQVQEIMRKALERHGIVLEEQD